MPAAAAACSGSPVSFEQIRTGAERIVIASIVDVDEVDGVSNRVTLRVERLLRGVSGPDVTLEPPTYMGCGGQMNEPVGARLVVATGPHYFSASPPEEMHPYWLVLAGDRVVPAGVDDPDPDHTRLDGLIEEFGALPAGSVEPESVVDPVRPPDGSGIAAIAIVGATLLAAVAVFTGAWRLGRRHR
jgi:hypothetical protein